jgi:tRNA(Ile)-lysidine synthase
MNADLIDYKRQKIVFVVKVENKIMNDPIFESLRVFLDKSIKGPLLLGYSGGYDSKALLYLLKNYKDNYGLDLHLAHVDHKWRESSTGEALALSKEAEMLKLPFHLKTLDIDPKMANIEACCRELRLKFFEELFEKYSCRALLLAHHKDDLSETVLKRLLEGADLPFLKGMEKQTVFRGMNIWRPLLDFSKKELGDWLEKHNLVAIDDETNRDNKYLRSRIRQEIIPSLSLHFGKEVSKNLALTSKRSIELKEYLDKKTQKYFDSIVFGPFGLFLDFSLIMKGEEIESFEIKHLLRGVANAISLDLSRDVIERCCYSLSLRKNLLLKLKASEIIIQNNILFILKDSKFFQMGDKIKLCEGKTKIDQWEISVAEIGDQIRDTEIKLLSYSNWKEIFKGQFEVVLPKNNYFLTRPLLSLSYYNKRLSKWFSENKVPTFIRFSFPVIFKDDKMYYEFLSGKKRFKESSADSFYRISFKLSC